MAEKQQVIDTKKRVKLFSTAKHPYLKKVMEIEVGATQVKGLIKKGYATETKGKA